MKLKTIMIIAIVIIVIIITIIGTMIAAFPISFKSDVRLAT
jgi:hypothetical protein